MGRAIKDLKVSAGSLVFKNEDTALKRYKNDCEDWETEETKQHQAREPYNVFLNQSPPCVVTVLHHGQLHGPR